MKAIAVMILLYILGGFGFVCLVLAGHPFMAILLLLCTYSVSLETEVNNNGKK